MAAERFTPWSCSPSQDGAWSVIIAFTCFGVLTILSRALARILRQERWPPVANVLVNVGLVIGSFDVGFGLDGLLR